MDPAGNMNFKRLAKMSAVWGLIILISMSHDTSDGGFYILDMGENACHTIFCVFVALSLLAGALYHRGFAQTWMISLVAGTAMAVFGICLLADIVDNGTGYAAWTLAIAGIGNLYCGYLGRKTAPS